MTIDERLEKISVDVDRLKERHEALTKSVELHTHNFDRITRTFAIVLDSIKRLENIAGLRRQRI